jgi:5-methylcytosine-specific restriction endonuclease McrA
MNTSVKLCRVCKRPHPLSDFQKMTSAKDGLQPRCRTCQKEAHDKSYHKHRDKTLARQKKYQSEHRAQYRIIAMRYKRKHIDEIRENDRNRKKQRRRIDPEFLQKERLLRRQHYRSDKLKNPDLVRLKGRFSRHQYRTRKRSASGTHTIADIRHQYRVQKGFCYYCKCALGEIYHVDHVIPLSRGGSNDPSNLVISCPTCNTSKGAKLPSEWPQGGRLL